MKCKLLYERELSMEANPPQALINVAVKKGKLFWLPVGTIIDHPDCHYLVKMGQASAYDEDCRAECDCSPEAETARLLAAEMLNVGINPEHRSLYIAGYIRGYDGDGKFIPGPKWAEYQASLRPLDKDEDDI